MSENIPTESPALLLAKAHESFKKEEDQRKRDFEKNLADLVLKVKGQVRDALKQAQTAFNTLDEDAQRSLLSEAATVKLLATFGKVKAAPTSKRKATKTRKAASRSSATKEDVLEYIKTSGKVTVGQIDKHFATHATKKTSKVTVGNRRKELSKEGKICETTEGTKTFVEAV